MDGLTPEKIDKFVKMLVDLGHESPIEHVSFTFGIEGVSRSLLAQITRHRIASYSVQSQRYVPLNPVQYVTPHEIADVPEASEIFNEAMLKCEEYYHKLSAILKERHKDEFLKQGMSDKQADISAEKKAIEDARYVLPNACETKIVLTMNARSLMNFFNLRCCNRAQWEIREVAQMMLAEVKKVAPLLFSNAGPSCVSGPCSEGKMTCGKVNEMRSFYNSL